MNTNVYECPNIATQNVFISLLIQGTCTCKTQNELTIFSFKYKLFGTDVDMLFTSVPSNVLQLDFCGRFKDVNADISPLALLEAVVIQVLPSEIERFSI